VSIQSNQARAPERSGAGRAPRPTRERQQKPSAPSSPSLLSGRRLLVWGVVVLLAPTALIVALWPHGERAKPDSPRPDTVAAPETPIRQARKEPAPQEKSVASLRAGAADPTPPSALKPEHPAVVVAPPPAQDGPDHQGRRESLPDEKSGSSPPAAADPAPLAEPQPAGPPRPTVAPSRGTGSFGTCVEFVNNPVQASQKALQEQKLLFTVHISGNFEDSHFT